jgi:hypothetical protein
MKLLYCHTFWVDFEARVATGVATRSGLFDDLHHWLVQAKEGAQVRI